MSIGAIGNTIYVNQQTASVSSVHGNQNNRLDLQNVAAQTAVNEKEKKILEVRPAEENHEIDSDREHEQNDADQKNKRAKKEQEQDKEEEETFSEYKLDIKV